MNDWFVDQARIEAVERFGYSLPEATFLCLAALHGGYFVRRQFNSFIQRKRGWRAANLIDKLIRNGHAKTVVHARNRAVYHISAKPFYAALGEQDNRNRRDRQPFTIKNKLMALDYVLAHPGQRYLATEREKCAYFTTHVGISSERLPVRSYESADRRTSTVRYFVDKFPIHISAPLDAATPVVSLCFVDEGLTTLSRLETHVIQYSGLLLSLPSVRFVYIADSDRLFRAAEQVFRRVLARFGTPEPDGSEVHDARLREHFRDRDLFERRQTSGFNKERLDQLRKDLQTFAGERYQAVYDRWKQDRDASSASGRSPGMCPTDPAFDTHLLLHDYNLFGTILERAS